MSDLSCFGKREVEITYTHKEPDKILHGGYSYQPINGGDLGHEWIENLSLRRYLDVGLCSLGDERECGVISAYICGYYHHSSLGLNYLRDNGKWYLPLNSESDTRVYVGQYTKNEVDPFNQ